MEYRCHDNGQGKIETLGELLFLMGLLSISWMINGRICGASID
jgi:hypothetical protein